MLGSFKTKISRIAFIVSTLLCVSTGAVQAQHASLDVAPVGNDTSAPIGWAEFCTRTPAECSLPSLKTDAITLNERSWREIVKINAAVNREIEPVTDMDHHGIVELWSYPTDGKGDCEDYVLEKRRRLMRAGYPRQALLITVVRDKKGDGHAILTVKTDRGDFILDNQVAKVLAWSETGYRFIKRQAQDTPSRWVSLGGYDTALTAATEN